MGCDCCTKRNIKGFQEGSVNEIVHIDPQYFYLDVKNIGDIENTLNSSKVSVPFKVVLSNN